MKHLTRQNTVFKQNTSETEGNQIKPRICSGVYIQFETAALLYQAD